jgi:excisionase family DNA binding protein
VKSREAFLLVVKMNSVDENLFLKPAEAAAVLRISRAMLYRLVQRGILGAIFVGRHLRIHRDALTAFMEHGTVTTK